MRTIDRSDGMITVSYPSTIAKADAWRHLLANKPEGAVQPRGQSHRQLWTKAHTVGAWVWRATMGASP